MDTLTRASLAHFTGTGTWYRHPLNRTVLYTEGAKHVAEAGGAYWLLDEVALSQQGVPAVAVEPFQVWRLAVDANRTARLRCENGNGNAVFDKPILFTDFPLDEVVLWFTDNTILLPSEY